MGYRLSKIYTRTGDDGRTQVGVGERILKNSLRIESLGTLDELNCAIGLILSHGVSNSAIQASMRQIQQDLFDLGGELCPPYHMAITDSKVSRLEQEIDDWNANLPPLKEFILPGGNVSSAHCHMARAICRRTERCLVALHQEEPLSAEILRYVNRLSDLLFVAARVLAKEDNQQEILWEHERNKK